MPMVIPYQAKLVNFLANPLDFPLNPVSFHLYQNPVFVARTTTLAEIVECDFSGYAPFIIDNSLYNPAIEFPVTHYTCFTPFPGTIITGTGTQNDLYGYYFTDSVTGELAAIIAFFHTIFGFGAGNSMRVRPFITI